MLISEKCFCFLFASFFFLFVHIFIIFFFFILFFLFKRKPDSYIIIHVILSVFIGLFSWTTKYRVLLCGKMFEKGCTYKRRWCRVHIYWAKSFNIGSNASVFMSFILHFSDRGKNVLKYIPFMLWRRCWDFVWKWEIFCSYLSRFSLNFSSFSHFIVMCQCHNI